MNVMIGVDGGGIVSRSRGAACAVFIGVLVVAGAYLLRRALGLQRRQSSSKHAARYSHPHR